MGRGNVFHVTPVHAESVLLIITNVLPLAERRMRRVWARKNFYPTAPLGMVGEGEVEGISITDVSV